MQSYAGGQGTYIMHMAIGTLEETIAVSVSVAETALARIVVQAAFQKAILRQRAE